MSIKMKVNNKLEAKCCNCGRGQKQSVDMFDVMVGKQRFTICDACNDLLFTKTLNASCYRDHRVKGDKDISVAQDRRSARYEAE